MSKARIVRHRVRGTTYEVIGRAEAQVSKRGRSDFPANARMLFEGDPVIVYRCRETGKLWCRMADEFGDGRFEEIAE